MFKVFESSNFTVPGPFLGDTSKSLLNDLTEIPMHIS